MKFYRHFMNRWMQKTESLTDEMSTGLTSSVYHRSADGATAGRHHRLHNPSP